MFEVVVKAGPDAGRRVELGERMAIGRQDGDLVLEDPEVSRRHAMLRRSGRSVIVEDLGSTNGTFVNGHRVREPSAVGPGDEVRVGQTTLEIEPDSRADLTVVSTPVRPDQPSAQSNASTDVASEHEDATEPLPDRTPEPLPDRTPERRLPQKRPNRRLFALGAVVLATIMGIVAYAVLTNGAPETDFVSRLNNACEAVSRSGGEIDLRRSPTRGELEHTRSIRLQALGAIRAIGQPGESATSVEGFLSAFTKTNASITVLETALASRRNSVGRALARLREDVRVERDLAEKAGVIGCGGLAIR